MVGFGANRRGGRLPSFILIALMVIIAILSFNYWTVSNKQGHLLDELAEVQTQVKRTDAARSRLEKRNSELMVQVDTHRKHIDQKDGDNSMLEGKLQAREALVKKCTDEKMKVQGDVTAQMSEIVRLKEQLKELKQEFMRQEIQLREVKKNSTNLERKLEYESLQCGRQITQLMDEYEEAKKTLEEEAVKLRKSVLDSRKVAAAEGGTEVETAGEHPTVATHRDTDLKEGLGKPGSDAGMPGIEDSEVGKIDDVQFGEYLFSLVILLLITIRSVRLVSNFNWNCPPLSFSPALKKPAITQNHIEIPDTGLREVGAGMGAGAGEGAGRDLSLDLPVLQIQDKVLGLGKEGRAGALQQQPPQAVADRPILFDEDNKAAIQADEFGEQHRPLRAPANVMKADGVQRKGAGLPLPPNPAQVPNPIEPLHGRDPKPAEPLRHRQNDEDRDMQGDRAVDYGKRRQAIDIL
uniref:Protein GOLM2 n=1 Tax=Oncorhynchus kisutch TaxID=8019 RepID=A0A8C7G9U3_ONCKI